MPGMVQDVDFTTLERIEEGALAIAFCDATHNVAYEDEARLRIGDQIRSYIDVSVYTGIIFEVCMGEPMPNYIAEHAQLAEVQPGAQAIPFVLPAIGKYPAYRCGLKPKRAGVVAEDVLDIFVDALEVGERRNVVYTPPKNNQQTKKSVPIVVDVAWMQEFVDLCVTEKDKVTYGLTSAVLVRLYRQVRPNVAIDDAKDHVFELIKRGFFVASLERMMGEPEHYEFGTHTQPFLRKQDPAVEVVSEDPQLELCPNLALAQKVTKRAEAIAAELTAERARAEVAHVARHAAGERLAVAEARIAQLEAQLAALPAHEETEAQQREALAARLKDL